MDNRIKPKDLDDLDRSILNKAFRRARQVPAMFMATAADWMSAASFIGMAGTLYAAG